MSFSCGLLSTSFYVSIHWPLAFHLLCDIRAIYQMSELIYLFAQCVKHEDPCYFWNDDGSAIIRCIHHAIIIFFGFSYACSNNRPLE